MKLLPRSPAAVAAVLVATLAACTGTGPGTGTDRSPAPTIETSTTPLSAEPAEGSMLSNDDFSFAMPEGWAESEQTRAIALAIDLEDHDAFPDSINVVTDDSVVGIEGAELEEAAEQILADVSATHITTKEPVQIDGEQAVHTSAYVELSNPKHRVEQYVVVHDETGYIVTVSFSPDVPAAERDALSESILTTWRWDS